MYLIIMISFSLVLLLTPAAVLLSLWIRSRMSLPLLTTIAGYFPFLLAAQSSLIRGFLLLLWWTLILSICVIWLTLKKPLRASQLIWRSREYTDSMFGWIETGQLPEGSAGSVLRFHIVQALIYCGLALVSANFLALVLGAALLNYMNFYVASFARSSSGLRQILWMAWNPWSVIRVLAFLYLGIVVSTPALWLLIAVPWRLSPELFLPGVAGLIADLILKLTFSRNWSSKLREFYTRSGSTQS